MKRFLLQHRVMTALFALTVLIGGVWGARVVPIPEWVRLVFGCVFILFLPGLFMSLLFFPHHTRLEEGMPALITRGHLDIIERITVSFLLSIVMSSGVILALYKLSVADRFNAFNLTLSPRDFVSVMLVIESVSIVVALFFSVWRNRSNRHNRSRDDG